MQTKKELLDKYSRGECNQKEIILVEKWFSQLNSGEEQNELELQELLKKIDIDIKNHVSKKLNWSKLSLVATILGVLCFGGLVWKKQISSHGLNKVAKTSEILAPLNVGSKIIINNEETINLDKIVEGDSIPFSLGYIKRLKENNFKYLTSWSHINKNAQITFQVGKGATSSLSLLDGSIVWLNENSKIDFDQNFINERNISLEGEGYFIVKPLFLNNNKIPFSVKSNNFRIDVLGTQFNITQGIKHQVALMEGMISVVNENKNSKEKSQIIKLNPNQLFDGDKVQPIIDKEAILAWKNDQFHLTNKSLNIFSKELSNWYGIEIDVEAVLLDKPLYGSINRRLSLEKVLIIIGKVLPIEYELKNNHLKIYSKRK